MRKRVRQWFLGISLLLLSLQVNGFSMGNAVFAAQKGNVYDEADLLTEQETDALAEKISALMETTGWNIYAVTTDDAGGKSAEAYADDFFDSHSTEQEDGVAALIDMDNREIYLSTCGEAIRYLTDERLDYILDDAYGEISEGNYAACLDAMIDGTAEYYEGGIQQKQYNYDEETGEISVYRSITLWEALIAVVIAVVVFGAVFGCIVGKYRLKFGNYEYDFRRFGSMELKHSSDVLVNTAVTHRRIPQNNGGGSHSSSGRSTTHHSSSGRSHGGSGRKF
ncbi:MAG: TPM domain-containing protein [Roseburia sp.]|nr:TPM domain-containing protein [Roseburia sp.]